MFLYLGGCLDAPKFIHLLYICTPPGYTHPPYAPILFCASVCFWRLCMLWGVVMDPLCVGTPPLYHPYLGVPSLQLHHHTQSLVPCALVFFRDISMLCGHFPSVQGFGGVPPSVGRFGGTSALEMSICSFLYIFCSALCLMFQLWL